MKFYETPLSLSYTWIGGMEPDDSVTSIRYSHCVL